MQLLAVLCLVSCMIGAAVAQPDCSSWFRADSADDESYYQVFTSGRPFNRARDFCRGLGKSGNLAVIRNKETFDYAAPFGNVWIGVYKPDHNLVPISKGWINVDGTPIDTSVTPWCNNEPNNHPCCRPEMYAHITRGSCLNDHNIKMEFLPLCELKVADCSANRCPSGSYRDTSSSKCVICPIGRFSTSVGMTSCTSCPSGKSTLRIGSRKASMCVDCPEGKFSSTNDPVCRPCPPGSYADYSNSGSMNCIACPPLTYGFNNYTNPCLPCPAGYFSQQASTSCTICPPGSFPKLIDSSKSDCVSCPAGKFGFVSEETPCKECPSSTFSKEGWLKCLPNKSSSYENGCADGEREWFLDQSKHPLIAGCAGAFHRNGVKSSNSESKNDISCGNSGGDDGPFPFGELCSASDICAEGWHLCHSAVEVRALSGTGDCDNPSHPQTAEDIFFASAQSSIGDSLCSNEGVNDILGCGKFMETDDKEFLFGSVSSKLFLWLDAESQTFVDSKTKWKDKSGSGNDFSLHNPSAFQIDSTDNRPFMDFSGQYGCAFREQSIPIPASGTMTVFAVTRVLNSASYERTFLSDGSCCRSVTVKTGTNDLGVIYSTFVDSKFDLRTEYFEKWNVISFELSRSSPYLSIFVNGQDAIWQILDSNAQLSSGFKFIGGSSANSNHWGHLRELLVFQDTMISTDRKKIFEFLSRKWNLGPLGRVNMESSVRCGGLDKLISSLSSSSGSWATSFSTHEAITMEKLSSSSGGVLCCKNVSCPSCEDANRVCQQKNSGCSDGTREWFIDTVKYPDIAGCAGGFDNAGLFSKSSCDRKAGNNVIHAADEPCSAEDLCEEGWKVCDSIDNFVSSTSGKFCDSSSSPGISSNTFFASAIGMMDSDVACGDDVTSEFLLGCGNSVPGRYCSFKERTLFDSKLICNSNSDDFQCLESDDIRQTVIKANSGSTGVLCCREKISRCKSCGPGFELDCDRANSRDPWITAINPNSGSSTNPGLLEVVGQNFGLSGTVRVGDRICSTDKTLNSLLFYSSLKIVCLLPDLPGGNLLVSVENDDLSVSPNEIFFSVDPPIISHVRSLSNTFPTLGAARILIEGANFGTVSAKITIGTSECVEIFSSHRHTSLECILPKGQGTNIPLVVEIVGKKSNAVYIDYSPSLVTTIVGQNGATTGGSIITLFGTNFGSNGIVRIGDSDCAVHNGAWSDVSIACVLPDGEGLDNDVILNVSGVLSLSSGAKYSYAPPQITHLSTHSVNFQIPNMNIITLTGKNFGKNPLLFINDLEVDNAILSVSIFSIHVTLPFWISGDINVIRIQASGQFSDCTIMNCSVSIEKPIINAISGCIQDSSGSGTERCPLNEPSRIITISGFNFGLSQNVKIQGKICELIGDGTLYSTALHSIECFLPSNDAGQLNALVEVEVNGKVGFSRALSYLTPSFSIGSLKLCSSSSPSGLGVVDLSSNGGEEICFKLNDVSTGITGSELTVLYGPYEASYLNIEEMDEWFLPYSCKNIQLSLDRESVRCVTSNGVGSNLTLLVQIGKQIAWSWSETLSYVQPVLMPSSIGGFLTDAGEFYDSSSSMGDSIRFDVDNFNVTNFSNIWSRITIEFGSSETSESFFICELESVQAKDGAMSTVYCFTGPGEGSYLYFRISALGSTSSMSSFYINFPQAPVIHSVRSLSPSCTNLNGSVVNCSTEGGQRLNIKGEFFCDFSRLSSCSAVISVGFGFCLNPRFINSQEFECTLPPLSGRELSITIQQTIVGEKTWLSAPKNLISYAAPEIFSVSGCIDRQNATYECSRSTFSIITVEGINFGPQNAVVKVDYLPCENLLHDSETPHRRIICQAPNLGSLDSDVLLIQYGGSLSVNLGRISYEQCPAGTKKIQGSLQCEDCPIGKYNKDLGSSSCDDCSPGTFAFSKASTVCLDCSAGNYSNAGANQCILCSRGKFAQNSRSSSCTECDVGKFGNLEGQTGCLLCGSGTFGNVQGLTACIDCNAGKYSISRGSTSCIECIAGFYEDETKSTSCKRCDAGSRSHTISGSTQCTLCEISTYSSSGGLSSCSSCEPGRITSLTGSTVCELCEPGKYDDLKGFSYCFNCSAGSYSFRFGTIDKCNLCLPGSFSSSEGSTYCEFCPSGKAQPEPGQLGCIDCPSGTVSVSPGKSICIPCEAGYISPTPGLSACLTCPPGTYTGNKAASKTCKLCPKGTFSPSPGSIECTPCEVGKFGDSDGKTICEYCPRGTYQMNSGESHCELCSPGFFAEDIGSSLCLPCGLGTVSSNNGSFECSLCAPGDYQPFTGASTCLKCPPGKASGSFESISCGSCVAGQFSNSSGSSACDSCVRGRFQPLAEQQNCMLCPAGKFSFQESSSCTKCGPRSISPFPGLGFCVACPENSVTDDEHSSCICNEGFYGIDKAIQINNDSAISTECLPCPMGAKCDFKGARWENLETLPGWWRASPNSTSFYQCLLIDHCTGGLSASCGGNREGVLCNRCKPGFEVIGTDCVACSSSSRPLVVFIFIVLCIAVIVFLMFYVVLKMDKHQLQEIKNRTELENIPLDIRDEFVKRNPHHKNLEEPTIDGAPSPSPNFVYKLKIILGFFQISVALALSLDIPWPNLFKSFIATFNVANFDIVQWTRFGCVVPITFFEKHLAVSIFPIALICIIYVVYLLPKTVAYFYRRVFEEEPSLISKYKLRFKRGKRKFYKLVLFSVFLIYPTVSSVILSLYSCRSVEGTSYLTADFRIQCSSKEWKDRAKLNILFTLLIPVAIPICFALLLFTNRKNLNRPETLVKIGFLYGAYFADSWWFELLDVLHKLFLTSILVFIPLEYRLQCAIAIVLLYLMLFLIVRPYVRKGDDRLQGIVLTEILLMLLGGYIYREMGIIDTRMDIFLSILFISLTILVLLFVSFQVLSLVIKRIKKNKNLDDADLISALSMRVHEARADRRLEDVQFTKNPMGVPKNVLSALRNEENVTKNPILFSTSEKMQESEPVSTVTQRISDAKSQRILFKPIASSLSDNQDDH